MHVESDPHIAESDGLSTLLMYYALVLFTGVLVLPDDFRNSLFMYYAHELFTIFCLMIICIQIVLDE
jgi:hypothetical protein